MNKNDIAKELDKLTNDPKAKELLKSYDKPEPGKEAAVYAEIATKLGYNITEADLTGYNEKLAEVMKKRSEANINKIESLPDEDLAQVAGGAEKHSNCSDTYLDKENCWHQDGCDNIWNSYSDYVCHHINWDYACHASETEEKCGGQEKESYLCGFDAVCG